MTEPLDWARVPARSLPNSHLRRRMHRWEEMNLAQGRTITRRNDGAELVLEAWPADQRRELALDPTYYPIEYQIGAVQRRSGPWRTASVREALGVPAIFRANSMIATLVGSLTMRALRNEVELPPADRPQLMKRPDPRRTPRDFFRDTGWNLSRYGEAWWFVSARDRDDKASSLFNVPDPREVQVEQNDTDPTRPWITWRNRSTRDGTLRFDDMRQLTFLPSEDGLRGIGPLQLCGVATSVAVESQEWAANFYIGGHPSIWIKAAGTLGGDDDGMSTEEQSADGAESEAQRLKREWLLSPPNVPRITDDSIEDIKILQSDPNAAQALDARHQNTGDAAIMYGIPGSMLEYGREGASLTYQNLGDEFSKLVRACLRPGYLEPIEQAMSDLLPRAITARFSTEVLEAPDVKTRFEVYGLGITAGIIDAAYAQSKEGITPGDVENASVPQPDFRPFIPARLSSGEVRCTAPLTIRGVAGTCNRLLSTTGHYEGVCPKCKASYPAAA